MNLLNNYPLWIAISAIFFAQFVKVPLQFIMTKKINWNLVTSTGGMPSSHSAGVTALTTSVAIDSGLDSTLFAISAVFATIVMYDATGVRRQAGEQAAVINRLRLDFQRMISDIHVWQGKTYKQKQEEFKSLKELLGHKPVEVFFGGLTGVLWAIAIYNLFELF
ncbi:divergent PAP2 family protein [Lederbergia sp. NSJ-179]|uniref:divergent PAP2 family protein n=1 Tax=Lederbergia sp. NSJ-179 TaxID=2931402 RepID=UPI001FD1E80D|nr:divergent PAP2 family protein [Lederbergia sp. NSJ-179]MCJ7843468.1 divergent PAP2 family protein [Lederbergia sp. NSJ-179]